MLTLQVSGRMIATKRLVDSLPLSYEGLNIQMIISIGTEECTVFQNALHAV